MDEDSGSNPPPWIDDDLTPKAGSEQIKDKKIWVYIEEAESGKSSAHVVIQATPKAIESMCASIYGELIKLAEKRGTRYNEPVLLQLSDSALIK